PSVRAASNTVTSRPAAASVTAAANPAYPPPMTATRCFKSVLPRGFPCDPRLVQRRERDAAIEHTKTVAFDLGEQRAIHRGHHQARSLRAPITTGERCQRLRVTGSRALDLVRHELLERGRDLAPENIRVADAKPPQFILWQVDARALRVLADVADDVGELEGDAEVAGIGARGWVFVAEDLRRQQSDNAGDAMAIALERGEVLVTILVEAHRHAVD